MAKTLVRDVLYRVSDALQDLNPQFKRWSQLALVTYLNDGQRAIAKYVVPSCSRIDAVKLEPGTKQSLAFIPAARTIPGDGSDPADIRGNGLMAVVRNLGTDGQTVGNAVRLVDAKSLDTFQPDWHTKTGKVVTGYAYDPRTPKTFYVTPGAPVGTDVWVELSFIADPAEVATNGSYGYQGSDTTTISVDDKFVDDLVNYILARAYSRESENGNQALASQYGAQFISSINAQATALVGANPNLQTLPGALLSSTPKGNA